MKNKSSVIFLLALCSSLLSGCCTVHTNERIDDAIRTNNTTALCQPQTYLNTTLVYSGTYFAVHDVILLPWSCHGEGCMAILFYPALLVGGLIDLPLDIVADTLLLPRSIPRALAVECRDQKDEIETEAVPPSPPPKVVTRVPRHSSAPPAEPEPQVTPMVGKPPSVRLRTTLKAPAVPSAPAAPTAP